MEDEISHHSKEVAKGSLWTLAGSGIFYTVSFFYNIIIARAVSQDDLGLFFLSLTIVSLIGVIDDLGLASSIARYVPFFEGKGEKARMKALLRLSRWVVSASALITIALLWLSADPIGALFRNSDLPEGIRMFSLYLILSNLFNVNTSFIRGRADMRTVQVLQNTQNLLKLAFTIAFFHYFGASAASLTYAFLLSFVPPLLLSFFYVRSKTADLGHDEGGIGLAQLAQEILPFGIMVSVISSLGAIMIYLSRLLLGYFTDPTQSTQVVAIYSVAANLAGVLLTIPGSIGSIFMPIVARLYGQNDLGQLKSVTQTAQRWSLFLTVPFGLIMIAFSSDILAALYGEQYRAGSGAMSVLSLGFLITSVSFVLGNTLAAMRHVRVQLGILLISGAINVAVNVLLIPVIGILGAALASLCGFVATTALLTYYARKLFAYDYPPQILKLALAGSIALAIVLVLSPFFSSLGPVLESLPGPQAPFFISKAIYLAYLVMLVALTMGLFVFLSLLLRCFRSEDVVLMKKALSRAGLSGTPLAGFILGISKRGVGD